MSPQVDSSVLQSAASVSHSNHRPLEPTMIRSTLFLHVRCLSPCCVLFPSPFFRTCASSSCRVVDRLSHVQYLQRLLLLTSDGIGASLSLLVCWPPPVYSLDAASTSPCVVLMLVVDQHQAHSGRFVFESVESRIEFMVVFCYALQCLHTCTHALRLSFYVLELTFGLFELSADGST